MIAPIKVVIKGIKDQVSPIQVKVVDRVFNPDSPFMKPITIFVADIDVILAKLDKNILFRFRTECKKTFENIFGKVHNKIKSTFYLTENSTLYKLFGRIKSCVFKTSANTVGSTKIYGKPISKIKFDINVNNAVAGYFFKLKNKLSSNFFVNEHSISVIFNYRFRKWTQDSVLFQDTMKYKNTTQQITFGDTCYKETLDGMD